eukprot:3603894-Rhodomonas_salina.3
MPHAVACLQCHSRKKLCDWDYPCARCRCKEPQLGMDAGEYCVFLQRLFSPPSDVARTHASDRSLSMGFSQLTLQTSSCGLQYTSACAHSSCSVKQQGIKLRTGTEHRKKLVAMSACFKLQQQASRNEALRLHLEAKEHENSVLGQRLAAAQQKNHECQALRNERGVMSARIMRAEQERDECFALLSKTEDKNEVLLDQVVKLTQEKRRIALKKVEAANKVDSYFLFQGLDYRYCWHENKASQFPELSPAEQAERPLRGSIPRASTLYLVGMLYCMLHLSRGERRSVLPRKREDLDRVCSRTQRDSALLRMREGLLSLRHAAAAVLWSRSPPPRAGHGLSADSA